VGAPVGQTVFSVSVSVLALAVLALWRVLALAVVALWRVLGSAVVSLVHPAAVVVGGSSVATVSLGSHHQPVTV